ncbi:hypothetical protein EYZ11_003168 [Aspergillus tanneri]|uniref:Uncharacterized protein n=1 Tax=Aspergillus tanneri TaxID=1220188 RepID=A0A4V3UQ23_9EURO|nr:hypothetical protein EYZ11_003168 [Aspergillus tanneri]
MIDSLKTRFSVLRYVSRFLRVNELIYNNIPADGTSGPLPAWWYNILFIEEVTDSAISRSRYFALEFLRIYQSYSISARRCIAAPEIPYERVTSEASASCDQPMRSQTAGSTWNVNDTSPGEGMNAMLLSNFDLTDFQDISWLNSVPSSLAKRKIWPYEALFTKYFPIQLVYG